jgi:hypothetical protein
MVVASTGGAFVAGLVTGEGVVTGAGAVFREKVQPAVHARTITRTLRRQRYENDRMMFSYKSGTYMAYDLKITAHFSQEFPPA